MNGRFLLSAFLLLATSTQEKAMSGPTSEAKTAIAIIPQPLFLEAREGMFPLNSRTVIAYATDRPELKFTAEYLQGILKGSTGLSLPIVDVKQAPASGAIIVATSPEAGPGDEAYTVEITQKSARLTGAGARGSMYAVQSFLQLLPPGVFSEKKVAGVRWSAPCVLVKDQPRYGWRGMMLDVSRHFFPKEFVKKFIDYLVMHKMNTFHWHLCDDQGWRVEIQRYPKLTEVSAWRADKEDMNWNVRPEQQPGERATYGGFYTQEEIREVVRYAADRQIAVVPEIEMPAHASAVLAAYPELSCTGGPFTVPTGSVWPITDIYCAGNDSVFTFLEDVLREVTALFPGKYVHIGGDEADKTEWRRCPKCQARINAEGLKDEAELQSYFVKRMEKVLVGMGKRLIGWDEILEGGLPPEATVMSWRGIRGGIEAAQSGHDVVMSPTSHCYLDYYQGDWHFEPTAIGGFLPISTVYSLEPTPDTLTAEEAKHILGTQGNLWAEFLPNPAKVEFAAFPRIAAIAEVGWSAKERRDWTDFTARLRTQMDRYAARGINASRSAFSVAMQDTFDSANHVRLVRLLSDIGADKIRYTLDGSDPGPRSPLYAGPLALEQGATVTASTFDGSTRLGEIRRKSFFVTPPWGATVLSATQPDEPYTRGALLGNGRATGGSRDKEWLGYTGKDLEVVIDLGAPRTVRLLGAGFYHSSTERIFLPETISFTVSADGKEYRPAGILTNDISPKTDRPFSRDFVVSLSERPPGRDFATDLKGEKIRFIKMTAVGTKVCPAWHKEAGKPTTLMIDELFIE
jgi:hexosaminidase